MFRSETMSHYHLVVSREGAWKLLDTLGNSGLLGFREKPAVEVSTEHLKTIRGIEDLVKRLLYVEQESKKQGSAFEPMPEVGFFLKELEKAMLIRSKGEQGYLREIEEIIIDKTNGLSDLLTRMNHLKSRIELYCHEKSVLNYLKEQFQTSNYFNRGENCSPRITMISGTISKEDAERLRRMVFRISKGNSIFEMAQKKDHYIFVFWFSCIGTEVLKKKVSNLVDSMGANRVSVPQTNDQLEKRLRVVDAKITNYASDVRLTQGFINEAILYFKEKNENWSICSRYNEFMLFLHKEKAIYQQLGHLSLERMFYHGNCYAPKDRENEILQQIESLASMPNTRVVAQLRIVGLAKDEVMPTKFAVPHFFEGAQEITETYSIPKYKELNPSVISMITFPFLFGVMFGDVGHGLLLFAGILIVKPKHMALLLMASIFSIYCGVIYNEFLSLPLQFFPSCYSLTGERKSGCVYPFGLDSAWLVAGNGMAFTNSLKMKLSLILGIFHMSIGLLFNLFNLSFKSEFSSILLEFFPKIVFFFSIIGYLTVLVIVKWLTFWETPPPSLFSVFLGVFLHPGVLKSEEVMLNPYTQLQIQKILLYAAGISAVLMFTGKLTWDALVNANSGNHDSISQVATPKMELNDEYDETDQLIQSLSQSHKLDENAYLNKTMSEINEKPDNHGSNFVHIFLESVEFILGTVSHTASYLRLWALSLAHSELAKVFLELGLLHKIEHNATPLSVIIGFFIFANETGIILLGMDAMECFLHSLRLHWVEFQSKFFAGGGKKFIPFSFISIIKSDIEHLEEFKNRMSRGEITI